MIQIPFNKDDNGMSEIKEHIGGISADIYFNNVKPDIVRAASFVTDVVGKPIYNSLLTHYLSDEYGSAEKAELNEAVWHLQEAMAWKGINEYVAEGEVMFDNTGIHIQKSNDKQATAFEWQIDKLLSKYVKTAYTGIENLLTCLNATPDKFTAWKDSDFAKESKSLFIQSATEFDKSLYTNKSQRLYMSIQSIMRRIEEREIKNVLKERFDALKANNELNDTDKELRMMTCDAIAHLAMSKAIVQFPVEIMPDGVVEKFKSFFTSLNASKEARQSVTNKTQDYYQAEANLILNKISDIVFKLDNPEEEAIALRRAHSRNSIGF